MSFWLPWPICAAWRSGPATSWVVSMSTSPSSFTRQSNDETVSARPACRSSFGAFSTPPLGWPNCCGAPMIDTVRGAARGQAEKVRAAWRSVAVARIMLRLSAVMCAAPESVCRQPCWERLSKSCGPNGCEKGKTAATSRPASDQMQATQPSQRARRAKSLDCSWLPAC